jgi:hypothetical protein
MAMPIELPPGGRASGQLVYEIPGYYLDKLAQPPSARLELWDHVSDRRMTVPAEIGSQDRSRMIRSSGSAEILGPEYEAQPEQQGETAVSLHQTGSPEARPAAPEDEPAPIRDEPTGGPGRPA